MKVYEQPRIKFDILKSNKSNTDMTFVMSGLRKGMGQGLANFLRIAGYSYSIGYAPIAYKLSDVAFTQDTTDKYTQKTDVITKNIRKILVRPDFNKNGGFRTAFKLMFTGLHSGDLKLSDLKAVDLNDSPIDVEYINKDLVILSTSNEERIELSILVYFGVGYIGSEDLISNVPEALKPFLSDNYCIRLDVTFDGIKYINYRLIENNPTLDEETIVIHIRTNGAMKAYEELTFIGQLIAEHTVPLSNLYKIDWESADVSVDGLDSSITSKISSEMGINSPNKSTLTWSEDNQNERIKDLVGKSANDDMIIENLDLKPKAYNWLKGNNLQCIRDLRQYNETTGENEYPKEIKEELIRALRDVGIYEVFESNMES